MNTFMRRVHQACIAINAFNLALWVYLFSTSPSGVGLFFVSWSVAFGAYSFHALRAERKGVRA
jgi:hypothetical protein